MASDKMIKVSKRNYARLVAYGVAGESIDTALGRVLDLAEGSDDEEDTRPHRPRSAVENIFGDLPEQYR
jgi:hypothetical protein